LSTKGGPSFHI